MPGDDIRLQHTEDAKWLTFMTGDNTEPLPDKVGWVDGH